MHRDSDVISKLHRGLIVSCQAHEGPLRDPYIMRCMAQAAQMGGAVGIRANSIEDIQEIKKYVSLTIIGIIKRNTPGFDVYITPTLSEVAELASACVDIIAMDATLNIRPDGIALEESFPDMKKAYPDVLFMADCATLEEGKRAEALGFDLISTTLFGYTPETRNEKPPGYDLMKNMVNSLNVPIVAEGGIWTPEQMREAFAQGVHCCVVGTAITNPLEITKRFVTQMNCNPGRTCVT